MREHSHRQVGDEMCWKAIGVCVVSCIDFPEVSTSRCFTHCSFIEDSTLSECALLVMSVIVSVTLLVYSYILGFHIEFFWVIQINITRTKCYFMMVILMICSCLQFKIESSLQIYQVTALGIYIY